MSEAHHLPRISMLNAAALRAAQETAREELMEQVESAEDLQSWIEGSFNPIAMMRNFKTLSELKQESGKTEKKSESTESKLIKIEEITETAERMQKNNYELQVKTLLILRNRAMANDSEEDVLAKVLGTYSDHALADEALDFLIETSRGNMQAVAKRAKEQLNQQFSREILAGRNIGAQSREFSEKGLGSATSLRDLYREITGTPREPLKLFQELSDLFPYEKLKTTILFLLHSLGADLKSKGPSIPRGELKTLIDETRSLQGILGVFRFFESRMQLISRQFSSYGLTLSRNLTFEMLAKQFIKLLAERYVNAEKILQTAQLLGISEKTMAQIIIFTQMRDAMRQIALRYYRNPQHLQELTKAMLEALEKLEDDWDEEEEKEEK
jgi:type III secretion protein W